MAEEDGVSNRYQAYAQAQVSLSPELTLNAGFHSQYFEILEDATKQIEALKSHQDQLLEKREKLSQLRDEHEKAGLTAAVQRADSLLARLDQEILETGEIGTRLQEQSATLMIEAQFGNIDEVETDETLIKSLEAADEILRRTHEELDDI